MKKILVTGGAGYIGSHTSLVLLEKGYEVVVIDNLCNSSLESLERVKKLTGKNISFYNTDLMDCEALEKTLSQEKNIFAVIHFAALKAVGESVEKPLMYYENNISGTLNLLKVMLKNGMDKIVFSSSATVYGDAEICPVTESAPVKPTNPYGQTKLMMEQILRDCASANNWDVTLLRYFNPVGAHPSGEIGEDPDYPNNLLPFIQQVAAGIRPHVTVFGNDYDTPDGTGVRDYIHVMDLAEAHVAAIENMYKVQTFNIGTGQGYSVLEMVRAFEEISGKPVPVKIGSRREGDVAILTADPALASQTLNWQAQFGLKEMVRDAWNWQSKNPKGFKA
ncbi:MAG: UDP-glucose 4-epimerase GalE [Lentisphaeraceae bacterium]|nr:UDP-glucose 4-epimerase GalE [Lentisphaeraceae bacterium]